MGKRDKDMRITLDTNDFPFAEFFGKLITPFDPNSNAAQSATVQGAFKIHGVSQEQSFDGTLQMTVDGLLIEAAWALNLKDYEIVPPKLLFIKVDETQEIQAYGYEIRPMGIMADLQSLSRVDTIFLGHSQDAIFSVLDATVNYFSAMLNFCVFGPGNFLFMTDKYGVDGFDENDYSVGLGYRIKDSNLNISAQPLALS